jgi:TetR/AcrR family transcriptional regulator
MSEPGEPGSRRGRIHDARGAREAILNAAEVVFAEHGFDGARIDAIAEESGYNKSLLFQYFGDKLGLYAEVIKRTDREMTEFQVRLLAPLLEDETIASNAHKFRALLATIVAAIFDYLAAHPHLVRMLLWEQAEGWQTYEKIISQFNTEDADQFEALFRKAYSTGLLRSDYVPLIQLTMILQICLSHLTYIPLYRMILPDEDLSSAANLARAREHIAEFVVHGMMTDPKDDET